MSNTNTSNVTTNTDGAATRRISTEAKAGVKTTEMIAFIVVSIAVLVAAQMQDSFGAKDAWLFVTILAVGYMISRGLAKSGSRDFYDDTPNRNNR
jgi:hypothetical protein